jgi:hypothetical protein
MSGVLKHRSSYDGFASFTAKAAALIFATVPAATIGFRVLFVIKGRRAGAVEEEEEEEEESKRSIFSTKNAFSASDEDDAEIGEAAAPRRKLSRHACVDRKVIAISNTHVAMVLKREKRRW